MQYRFECSDCKGTFDVPEQTNPPACPRKGTMRLISSATTMLIPSTGCENGNEANRKLANFLNSTFRLPHFVPGTGRGNINCLYRPRTGILDVRLSVSLEFKTSSFFSYWSESEKNEYKQSARDAVDTYWNNRATIACVKPYWDAVLPVTPRFTIDFMDDPMLANYHIAIIKDPDPFTTNGLGEKSLKCSAYIGMAQVLTKNPSATITGQLQSFQTQTLNLMAATKPVGQDERVRLETAVRDTASGSISFAPNDATVSAQGKITLTNLAWKARQNVKPTTPLIPFKITGHATGAEARAAALGKDRADAVAAILRQFKIPQPIETTGAAPSDAPKAVIALDKDFEDDLGHYIDPTYNIFAHEFGHMIGLPDEYLNEQGLAGVNPKVVMQVGLVQLASEANVLVPTFGKATTSMMSYGKQLSPCHFLTIWDALRSMTRGFVEDKFWKIHIRPG